MATSAADMPVMTFHTWSRSAIRGRIPTHTPIAMAGNNAIRTTLMNRRRAVATREPRCDPVGPVSLDPSPLGPVPAPARVIPTAAYRLENRGHGGGKERGHPFQFQCMPERG